MLPFDILHATTNQTPGKVVVEIGVGVNLGTTNSAVVGMIGGALGGVIGHESGRIFFSVSSRPYYAWERIG
jgi:hypothetical protein